MEFAIQSLLGQAKSSGYNTLFSLLYVCCKHFLSSTLGKLWGHCSVQFSSVAQSCPTLCDPMNRSTPGLPVHHKLPDFPYFLQFKSEFCNKEFMIWATVRSWSCFCWVYRVSPSLAAKNIINLISVLTIWWCVEFSLVLLEEGVCYDQCVLLAKLY